MARTKFKIDSFNNPYKARAYRATSTQVITQTDLDLLELNTESYDPNNNFASYEYTVPVTGYYLLNGATGIYNPSPSGSAHHYLRFVKNFSGSWSSLARYNSNYTNVSYLTMNISAIVYLTAGDKICLAYETGDDNCELLTGADTSFFEVQLLSI